MPRPVPSTRPSPARTSAWLGALLLSGGLVACSAILGFEDLRAPDAADAADAAGDAPTPGLTVTVSASQGTSTFGGSVTFTAVVAGNRGTPTGSVTFSEGASTLGAFPLNAGELVGTAALTTSSLPAGVHTITATYGGNATYAAGAVGSVEHTVNAAATTTTLASSPNPASVGESVTLTATVSSEAPGPVAGTVTFKDSAATLGTGTVSGGSASLKTSTLAGGLHTITATYGGNANFMTSSSAPVRLGVTGPACQGLLPICGASNDCCASALVPGGTFSRSYDGVSPQHTNPAFVATVSDFRLDTYEVTVGRFRAFVQAGKGTQAGGPPAPGDGALPQDPTSGWRSAFDASLAPDRAALVAALRCTAPAAGHSWTDNAGANENKPINCVTWYEALAFCIWDGGRLATEAEWNYAAAGGEEQRVRPWSVPAASLVVDQTYAIYDAAAVLPVGSRPLGNGKWGHADLAGNVWEWTLDFHRTPYATPCNNCANVTTGTLRTFRGGGFFYGVRDTLSSHRESGGATYRGTDLGVRCARKP